MRVSANKKETKRNNRKCGKVAKSCKYLVDSIVQLIENLLMKLLRKLKFIFKFLDRVGAFYYGFDKCWILETEVD